MLTKINENLYINLNEIVTLGKLPESDSEDKPKYFYSLRSSSVAYGISLEAFTLLKEIIDYKEIVDYKDDDIDR